MKRTDIATKYGIASGTLSTIIKSRNEIEVASVVNQLQPARKRYRTGKNEDAQNVLLRWIRKARNQNIILTGAILQQKAKFSRDSFDVSNFICSYNWLSRFTEHLGIPCKIICGKEAVVDLDKGNSFFAVKWPAPQKRIFTLDFF